MQFKGELTNCFKHSLLVRFPCGHDGAANREGRDAKLPQPLDEGRGGPLKGRVICLQEPMVGSRACCALTASGHAAPGRGNASQDIGLQWISQRSKRNNCTKETVAAAS